MKGSRRMRPQGEVGDGGGSVDFQAQEQAAIEKEEKIGKGLGPKGGL